MPVYHLIPARNLQTCSVSEDGVIGLPRVIIEQLAWPVPSKVAVDYLLDPLLLLLRRADPSQQAGYTLDYQTRPATHRTGTKITCRVLAKTILRPRIVLPIRGLAPIFLPTGPYALALILESLPWVTLDFSQTGIKAIADPLKGVYQLLDPSGNIVRIGEGSLAARLREHLKDARLTSGAHSLQYFPLADKEETQLWERVLLAQYEQQTGQLPLFNRIRA